MKQCNSCTTDCRPGKIKLMSDDSCPTHTPIKRKFKFPELVSRVTISNPLNPTVQMLAIHTDKIFTGIA